MAEPVISLSHLVKRFGAVTAVDDLSLSVPTGSLFAFLGTNGAGKSTAIGCITTLLAADSGTVRVGGLTVGADDDAIRRRIGVVFQNSLLDPVLTARENLDLRAGFYGLSRDRRATRIAELAALIDLDDFLDGPAYGSLSGGQRRRVDIARALIHEPDILFLDEPTSGLDPQSREQVWTAISGLRATGALTVFLTTHYMAETEAADLVAIIDHGRLIAEGTPSQLRAEHSSSMLTLTATAEDVLPLCAARGLAAVADRDRLHIEVSDAAVARELLIAAGPNVRDFEFRHGTMDDVFLRLTQSARPATTATTEPYTGSIA